MLEPFPIKFQATEYSFEFSGGTAEAPEPDSLDRLHFDQVGGLCNGYRGAGADGWWSTTPRGRRLAVATANATQKGRLPAEASSEWRAWQSSTPPLVGAL